MYPFWMFHVDQPGGRLFQAETKESAEERVKELAEDGWAEFPIKAEQASKGAAPRNITDLREQYASGAPPDPVEWWDGDVALLDNGRTARWDGSNWNYDG